MFIRIALFLGQGRALEAYLIGVKLLFALFLFPPNVDVQILALSDLRWFVPDYIIALPFCLIGCIQLVGVIANYHGREWSYIPRAAGASIASCLWVWLIVKSILVDALITGFVPFCIMSLFGSLYLLWRSLNRLPVPGTPGLAL